MEMGHVFVSSLGFFTLFFSGFCSIENSFMSLDVFFQTTYCDRRGIFGKEKERKKTQ
jgi:hypothetical protein